MAMIDTAGNQADILKRKRRTAAVGSLHDADKKEKGGKATLFVLSDKHSPRVEAVIEEAHPRCGNVLIVESDLSGTKIVGGTKFSRIPEDGDVPITLSRGVFGEALLPFAYGVSCAATDEVQNGKTENVTMSHGELLSQSMIIRIGRDRRATALTTRRCVARFANQLLQNRGLLRSDRTPGFVHRGMTERVFSCAVGPGCQQ